MAKGKNTVGLGLGTLILIAIIVAFFSGNDREIRAIQNELKINRQHMALQSEILTELAYKESQSQKLNDRLIAESEKLSKLEKELSETPKDQQRLVNAQIERSEAMIELLNEIIGGLKK